VGGGEGGQGEEKEPESRFSNLLLNQPAYKRVE